MAAAYTGKIQLTKDTFFEIGKVNVQPQPFGAYIGITKNIGDINKVLEDNGSDLIKTPEGLRSMNILVVDPGEYTLDWLYMKAGAPVMRASNAIGDAGRHRVVREVHKMIQDKLGRPLGTSFYADIDYAMRTGKKFKAGGDAFNLQDQEFLDCVKRSIDDPVRQLFEGLRGSEERIDLVVVVGGSPGDVAAAIKRAKPWIPVYCGSSGQGNN